MPSRYHDREDLAAKVEWEGGVSDAILDYGITHDQLPEGTPTEVVEAWKRVEEVSPDERMLGLWLEDGKVRDFRAEGD